MKYVRVGHFPRCFATYEHWVQHVIPICDTNLKWFLALVKYDASSYQWFANEGIRRFVVGQICLQITDGEYEGKALVCDWHDWTSWLSNMLRFMEHRKGRKIVLFFN